MTSAAKVARAEDIAVRGEFLFTWRDFSSVAALLYELSGIHLVEGKANLVYSRLAKRLRATGTADFSTYLNLLSGPMGGEERNAFLSSLTTNVTRFYREPHHFEHLASKKMPDLVRVARSGGAVRIWSAGCSAGHEPYSIAMTVMEALPEAPSLDVRILASDIDPQIVERAATGLYSADDLEPIPAKIRQRHVTRSGDRYGVSQEVQSLVSFRRLNLLGEWPIKRRFDAIFCRNVAIYFDQPTQDRLFERFSNQLHDGAHLYIGHSERVQNSNLIPDGLTSYRRENRRA